MASPVTHPALAWISARHLRHMIASGSEAGLAVDRLLADAGIQGLPTEDAEGMVPLPAIEALLGALPGQTGDQPLGLRLARHIQPATFGAIGHLLQACDNFGEVLDMLERFNGLLSNIGSSRVGHGPGTVQLYWNCAAGGDRLRRHATDYVLGAFVTLARRLLPATQQALLAVNLPHARPAHAAQVREYFEHFRCPVHFEQADACVVLSSSLLGTRLRHGDPQLKGLLEQHANQLLQQRQQQGNTADDVRRLLRAMLGNSLPDKAGIAAQLGLSSRSLHRKLMESGNSYQALLDEVRLERARELLQASDEPVTRIAERLAFRSHQAFLRWFKQHAGQTPGAYRKEMSR